MNNRGFHLYVVGFVATALLLGGASAAGIIANLVLQLFSLPLIGLSIGRISRSPITPQSRFAFVLVALVMLLPIVQLVPLPASLWLILPGREPLVDGMRLLGVAPSALGLSLTPWLTVAAFTTLTVPLAAFLGTCASDEATRERIGWTILAVAGASILLGFGQYSGAHQLYPYAVTNFGSATGFFSNRNHLATLLLCAIPILLLQLSARAGQSLTAVDQWGRRAAMVSILAILAVALSFTGSRAGFALAVPALILCYVLRARIQSGPSPAMLLAGVVVAAGALLAILLYSPFFQRMAERTGTFGQDIRVVAAPLTMTTAWRFFPFGSGLGSFSTVFRWQAPQASLGQTYINHAHNDYLELWMTGGLPSVLLILVFLLWFARAIHANLKLDTAEASPMPRVAIIGIILILLHSLVDYPLRTCAILAMFAAFCAMLLPAGVPVVRRLTVRRSPRGDIIEQSPLQKFVKDREA